MGRFIKLCSLILITSLFGAGIILVGYFGTLTINTAQNNNETLKMLGLIVGWGLLAMILAVGTRAYFDVTVMYYKAEFKNEYDI